MQVLRKEIEAYIEAHEQEAYELLLTLARIPAPSNHEEKRAAFCREWLERHGARGVYIDEALNVVYPVDAEEGKALEAYMAHLDVVFSDETELPLREENGRIYCPGIGDDTACMVCVLMAAAFIAARIADGSWRALRPDSAPGLLLVCNAGEEGLGNLKGVRHICREYGARMVSFCTFDSCLEKLVTRAVGSRRFRLRVSTQGGHSFNDFGRPNAIERLAAVVCRLYQAEIPAGGRTTYNVGLIEGGTSVNTIAQEASLLYEFRSDRAENLDYMQRQLDSVLEEARAGGIKLDCELIGLRPCAGKVDEVRQRALVSRAAAAVEAVTGARPQENAGSTDCNIPLSLGIPSVCVGSYRGAGAHTREEYVERGSLREGYQVAFKMIFGEEA